MELEIKNLSKNYGKLKALQNVSVRLTPGVYGLLGPNGAGKSTFIKIITGNLPASGGQVYYNGKPITGHAKAYKKLLGYVPQSQGLYDTFTAGKFLEYMAILKAIPQKEIPGQISRVLEVVGLSKDAGRKLGGFSGGMRQRILIAQALLGSPEIIILDEPTAGLDPKERIKIRNFISRISENKIILLATHVVSDVESIAREIILLGSGKIYRRGTPRQLCGQIEGQVFEGVLAPEDFEALENICTVSNLYELPDGRLRLRFLCSPGQAPKAGALLEDMNTVFPNLQEVYLSVFAPKAGDSDEAGII